MSTNVIPFPRREGSPYLLVNCGFGGRWFVATFDEEVCLTRFFLTEEQAVAEAIRLVREEYYTWKPLRREGDQ
jgi:hypothetical protein